MKGVILMTFIGTSLRELYLVREAKRKRASSYDTSGGNRDFVRFYPMEKKDICEMKGSGCITHIWMTMAPLDDTVEEYLHRKIILRMYWDGEEHPSVEAPIGDFFG